jgi:hypothetical protein
MQDAGSVTMSMETIGSSVYLRKPLSGALGRLLDDRVDLLDGGLAAGLEGEVGGRAGRGGHAQGVAVELALELGQHEGDGLGGAGGRRDDVEGGGAGATQVLVRAVEQVLVLV